MVENLYFSGWTLSSHMATTFLALTHIFKQYLFKKDKILIEDKIGTVGSTGRSTGAHLDWRINWLDKRLDPELIANTKE